MRGRAMVERRWRCAPTLAVALVAALAAAVMVWPPTAAADNEPTTGYEGGDGSRGTGITLVDRVSTVGVTHAKENAKVQVPSKILFVAKADGTVEGPDNARIVNYASFPVHVSSISVADTPPVKLVRSDEAVSDDTVALQFTPEGGTQVELASFKGESPVTPASGEWDIVADLHASDLDITDDARTGTALALNGLGGKVGGFDALDPSSEVAIGTISWTVAPGALGSS